MVRRTVTAVLLVTLLSCAAFAQDAKTVIANASKAMGADNVKSIEYSGSGADFAFGQAMNAGGAWPKFINKTFTRTVNYETPATRLTRIRMQGEYPQSGGGGQPVLGEVTQNQITIVGPNTTWAQEMEIWMTPYGFLKAAAANTATVASQTVGGKKYNVVTFMGKNKAKVNGYINDQNLLEKVETWIDNNMYGDMLWDATYSQYSSFSGLQFPRRIIQRQGGFPILDWYVMDVKANAAAAIQPAAPAAGAAAPAPVTASRKLAEGIFLILPAYAAVAVDFKDGIVIIEGPQSEARADAVIAEAKKLIPNKPIKYLINTHVHFDHSGGLRTFAAEGATIITHESNRAYFERIFAAPHTLNPDKLALAKKKPAFETMTDRKTLTDGNHVIELYQQQGNLHTDGLVFAFLPKEKLLVEADAFNPPADPNFTTPAVLNMNSLNLFDNIQRLKLDIQTVVPIHYPPDGRPVGIAELYKFIGRSPTTTN